MKRLAVFDFDGTLTYKDSFLAFIRYYKGNLPFYSGMLQVAPWLVAYKLKLYPNWKAKEKVLKHFFANSREEEFREKGRQFARELIPAMLRPKAKAALQQHKKAGDRIVVVSASAEPWLQAWCEAEGIELVATSLECRGGRITGKLKGKNCYGAEKVERLKQHLSLEDYCEVHVYGDSAGDRELLGLATHPNYRCF
jgi:phosphatidylglycerophosphatase C